MTEIDQAARRAAEHVLDLDCECMECEAKTVEAKTIILAEFAPLQERLVKAEQLLAQAQASVAAIAYEFHYKKDLELKADIDKFLAANEAERE